MSTLDNALPRKKVFFAFGGLGGFAIGAQRAEMHLGGRRMGVKVIGGVWVTPELGAVAH